MSLLMLFQNNMGTATTIAGWSIVAPVVGFWHAEDFVLTEDGGYFLLEDASRLMLDTPPGDPWTKSAATSGTWH